MNSLERVYFLTTCCRCITLVILLKYSRATVLNSSLIFSLAIRPNLTCIWASILRLSRRRINIEYSRLNSQDLRHCPDQYPRCDTATKTVSIVYFWCYNRSKMKVVCWITVPQVLRSNTLFCHLSEIQYNPSPHDIFGIQAEVVTLELQLRAKYLAKQSRYEYQPNLIHSEKWVIPTPLCRL